MKALLRKIYYKIRYMPVIGELAQRCVAVVRNHGYGAARAVNWEQARQVSSLAERLEVAELLIKSQSYAIEGLKLACNTLRQESARNATEVAHELHGQMKEQAGRTEAVTRRVEFIRDEVLFELRKALKIKPAAAPGEAGAQGETVAPRIIEAAKLAQGSLRLNLGCGHAPHDDKINVDRRQLPGVDVVADVDNLPFECDSVELIYAAHLLEHFPRQYLLDVLLPYWRGLLQPGAALQLVVPDAQAMLAAHTKGEMGFDDLARVTFGKQDYDGDFHYAMYSPDTLAALLREAGFTEVEILACGRVNGDCREMEVLARKQ